MMLLTRVSSASAPVSLSEIMDQLRQPNDEPRYIEAIRQSAHDMVAEMSGRTLGSETWDVSVGSVGAELTLPRSPIQSITSISYYDTSGGAQTALVSDFYLFNDTDKATMRPKEGKAWPALQDRDDAMTVRFVAGYSSLPSALGMAVRLCAEYLYDRRMDSLPPSVEALVGVHRVGWVAA